jgi:hypothetical protein
MKKLLFFISTLLFITGYSQETTTSSNESSSGGVVVHKDPRIDLLIKKKAGLNKVAKSKTRYNHTTRGYRLMVISTNNRQEALDAKTKIYTYFPELKSYLLYQSPYFKLKAGNFTTRSEAEQARKSMSTIFPKGVFIISDIVEVKGNKDDDDEI